MTVNCKICGKQFDSFRGLNGHMNAHLPSHRKRAESELCDNCSGAGATIAGCTCGYMDYLKNAEGEEIYWNASCKPCYWESRFISTDKGQLPDYCPQCNKAVTLVAVDVENNLLAAEGDEELDDEDYWEPYLEALEVLWWHCVEYVDYASETYCGIVECMTLWTNVAQHSSAHDVGYIVNKVHKFKLEAIRYIWDDDTNYIWEKLEPETRELLENFNPEDRLYEGKNIPMPWFSGSWPSLNTVKEVFNPRWLPERGTAYAFDLYDAEEYTKRTGSRVTKGRKQRWIPVAIEYIRTHGKATAAEIHPSLPDHRSAATPIHAMALSNRLIRMPDIFRVDKSRKPYTYSLVETKEAEQSFNALEDDERICFTCGEITSDWDLINEGYECSECSELNRTDYERRKFGVEACGQDHLMCDDCMAVCLECNPDANAGGDICRFCAGHSVERFDAESDEKCDLNYHFRCHECRLCLDCNPQSDSGDIVCISCSEESIEAESFSAESGISIVKVYVEREDNRPWKYVTFEMPNHILNNVDILHEAIEARLMDILQEPFGGWDLISTEELGAESVVTRSLGEIPDWELRMMYKQGKISEAQMHIGIGLKMDAESFEAPYAFRDDRCDNCERSVITEQDMKRIHIYRDDDGGWKNKYQVCEPCYGILIEEEDYYSAESFEANYNPTQARDDQGRWTDNKSNRETLELDSDELSALADAIRLQDETFPDVDMLLEQIGDTPENRELVFQEMLDVLSGFISEVMDEPQVESQEDYYKYILEEPANNEAERLYRQANYYAQFKSSLEIEEALEELHFQYQMVKDMDGDADVAESIEKDINFVELVSRVQDMQREYRADWNPTQPRVPSTCPKCKGEEPCPCPKKPGKGKPSPSPPLPPAPFPEQVNNLWVNRITGDIYRGQKPSGEEWRAVEMVPIVVDGKQQYISNILDEVVKMWPPSSVVYRRNPPLLVITDNKINLKGLTIKGIKIDGNNLTYD